MIASTMSWNRLDGGRRLVLARDLCGIIVWRYDPRRDACDYLRWEELSLAEQCYAIVFAEDWWGVRQSRPRASLTPKPGRARRPLRSIDLPPAARRVSSR